LTGRFVRVGETGSELGCKYYFFAVALLGHPFTDPGLGFFVLVVVRTEGRC
jgi:hypothetical protein